MDRRLIVCMKTLVSLVNHYRRNYLLQNMQPVEIRLLTDIVIPPQVAFEVRMIQTLVLMALAL
jgi:hypothetical protein